MGWAPSLGLFCLVAAGCGNGRPAPASDAGRDAPAFDAYTAPECTGTPAACEGRSLASCGLGDGCVITECDGTPYDCSMLGFDVCDQVIGCTQTSSGCVGTPAPCVDFLSNESCGRQRGCLWFGPMVCGGSPTSCAWHDAATCASFPGCAPPGSPPVDAAVPACQLTVSSTQFDELPSGCLPRCTASTASTALACTDQSCFNATIRADTQPGIPYVVNGASAGTLDCHGCVQLALLACAANHGCRSQVLAVVGCDPTTSADGCAGTADSLNACINANTAVGDCQADPAHGIERCFP